MEWELEVDGRRTVITDVSLLQSVLYAPETRSARMLTLERIKRKRVPRWEKIVYRMLGLRLQESEAQGTLEVSISSDHAFVVFTRNDDDDGAIGTTENTASGRVEFLTPAGEKFSEAASRCIPRDDALAAMLAFMRNAKRPSDLMWSPVGKPSR
jgi:hypothetical protein